MASISVTYTFTNGTTASASEVNQNFTDVINGTSDGTKDLNINALTTKTLTANDGVVLGSSSADDLTINAALASSIPIKTQRSYNIGSADLGLGVVYFGGNSTHTVAFSAPSSGFSGDTTFSLPVSNGTANYALKTDGAGATAWAALETLYEAYTVTNLSDIAATKLGRKDYLHGTSYNGGNAPTVTLSARSPSTGTLSSVNLAKFTPFQTQAGTWCMMFKMNISVSSVASTTSITFAVNGITTNASVDQTFSALCNNVTANNGATATNNSNTLKFDHAAATTTNYSMSGILELASKPTWAY